VLGPDAGEADDPLVLRLEYGDFSVGLPATTGNTADSAAGGETTILVAPDLGAGNSGWTDAIAGVSAETVISYDDALQLPDMQVVYPSGDQGVHVLSDGESWQFK
jgi:hypothetical protein